MKFLLAVFLSSSAMAQDKRPPNSAQSQNGRFVIVFGPFARADTYLLDTHTGRVWQNVIGKESGEEFFEERAVAKDGNIAFQYLLQRIAAKKAQDVLATQSEAK